LHFVSFDAILFLVIEMRVSHISFDDIFLARTREEAFAHSQFSMHTHSLAELFLFVSGKAVFHIEGSEYPLHPGDVVLMRPAEAHLIETDPEYPYERVIMNFDTNILTPLDPENALMRPFFSRKAGKHNLLRPSDFGTDAYLTYLTDMEQPNTTRLAMMANLILLMQQVNLAFDRNTIVSTQPDTTEYSIIRYINQHLDRELTIQELCDQFYLSRAQLCRRFKKSTGTSVGKYICIKRLITAQHLIRQGQKPTEIFSVCGYQDYSTFYRAYTRYFGRSPKDERDPRVPISPETDQLEMI